MRDEKDTGVCCSSFLEVPIKMDEGNLPCYATEHSAAVDLSAVLEEPFELLPQTRCLIKTGISMMIPEGHVGEVRSRSGLALKHGVFVLNSPGTIDADYRGEIKVLLMNSGEAPFLINPGDRIAQFLLMPVAKIQWRRVDSLDETFRGEGGFGHTGM